MRLRVLQVSCRLILFETCRQTFIPNGVQDQTAIEASRGKYDKATKPVQRLTHMRVPKRQAIEIAQGSAADFGAFYKTYSKQGSNPDAVYDAADFVVRTTDGKDVVIRPEGRTDST